MQLASAVSVVHLYSTDLKPGQEGMRSCRTVTTRSVCKDRICNWTLCFQIISSRLKRQWRLHQYVALLNHVEI